VDNSGCFATDDASSLKLPGILRLGLAGKRLSSHGFLSGQGRWRDGQLGRSTSLEIEGRNARLPAISCSQIAVGNTIADVPPHRSGRARFGHPAPTSGE
jgi:hypothetical protein